MSVTQALRKARRPQQRWLLPVPCPVCGTRFPPRSTGAGQRQRYCSLECFYEARSRPLVPCPVCDAMFLPKFIGHGRVTRTCSYACRGRALRGTTLNVARGVTVRRGGICTVVPEIGGRP